MTIHHRIRCAEVWGGISAIDQNVETSSLAISIFSSPCEGVAGGDIYYVSVCGGDQLTRIAVADLQGHGEQVSALSRRIYESLIAHLGDVDNRVVLAELNQFAIEQGFEAMTTATVVSFLLADSTLSYTYAGHPPVLLRQTEGGTWNAIELPDHGGLVNTQLGVFPDVEFEQGALTLSAGDRFCIYTDGVLDCPDPQDVPFGPRRLLASLGLTDAHHLPDARAAVMDDLLRHSAGPLIADDTTLLMIEVR